MDSKHCHGCYHDFYNGNNPYGILKCWHLKNAKIVWKKKVRLDQYPPWKQKAIRVPDCRHEEGYIFMDPKQEC